MNIFKKLIQIKSISGKEEKIQKYILSLLTSYGFKPLNIKGNVALYIKGSNSKNCIIFNTHVDTVEAGEENLWKYGPFAGKEANGKIFGLGTSDEKAAVATLLSLAKKFSQSKPACDIWLTFVINEEMDGSGTKDFLNWFSRHQIDKYKNIAGILGEPTNLKKIEVGHKGNIFLKVTTYGNSGHGSKPEKIKTHSILLMYKVVKILKKLESGWQKKYKHKILGYPTISLTSIKAGDYKSPNKFPDSCIATFDIRTTPKIHNQAFKIVAKLLKKTSKKVNVDLVYPPVGSGFTEKEEKIVKVVKKISNRKIGISTGSNDMYFFTEKGIPALVFGPGTESSIHKPNEYCKIENINNCVKIYSKIINQF